MKWNINAYNELGSLRMSPESRFTGSEATLPANPPLPWNPEILSDPVWTHKLPRGHNELGPDERDEWKGKVEYMQPGRRRYSAYNQYGNRDGPQMAYGLHPSRSSLRPINSSFVRTIGARVLEGRYGAAAQVHVPSASEEMECRKDGPALVLQKDGTVRRAVGIHPPGGRPFSGYKAMVPTASAVLEGNLGWTLPKSKRPGVRLALGSRGGIKFGGGGGDQLSERLMDDIVAEIDGTDSSMSLGPSDDDSD